MIASLIIVTRLGEIDVPGGQKTNLLMNISA
jgi:hypothetical protein